MGLLDEAIREHLELKRRHGGDASEIAKLENEVLGPVPAEAPAATSAPVADVPLGHDEPDEAESAPPAAEAAEVHVEPEPEPAHHEPEPEPEPVYEAPAAHEPESAPAAEPEFEDEPVDEDPGQATVAFSLDELQEAEQRPRAPAEPLPPVGEPEPGEHDELEETPEFLQETPEHDRMWFEQKPPKDFDF